MNILFAHTEPEQTLEAHIRGALEGALRIIEGRKFPDWEAGLLYRITAYTAVFHDFGKATSYFQKKLLSAEHKSSELSNHSLISAVTAYCSALEIDKPSECDFIAYFYMFLTIKKHHSNLDNIREEILNIRIIISQKENLIKQADSIDFECWNAIVRNIASCFSLDFLAGFSLDTEKLKKYIDWFTSRENLEKFRLIERRYGMMELKSNNDMFAFLTLYSTLLLCDTSQASLRKVFLKLNEYDSNIDANRTRNFIQSKSFPASPINELRSKAFDEIEMNVLNSGAKLFLINLPTGMGKTLASFNATLKLRQKRFEQKGKYPRIIYLLPFLSIIDQNHKVIADVLGVDGEQATQILLKHHSLAKYDYIDKDEMRYASGQSELLIETWNASVVCTTYHQFFSSFLSNRRADLRRFCTLSDSIILMDEPQSLPFSLWRLFGKVFATLTQEMNADIILLTATQPGFVKSAEQLCNTELYYNLLDRINLYYDPENITTKEFISSLTLNESKSYLFVTNTINSAKELMLELRMKTQEKICFLSTHITPKERLYRIEEVKKDKYKIIVSTQLVEAGVDIDIDVVYRDFAPLDSIIQTAGRCNRNAGDKGEVRIVRLVNDKERSYFEMVYDKIKITATEYFLPKNKFISENEFKAISDNYFNYLREGRVSQSDSDAFLCSINSLYFDDDHYRQSGSGNKIPISRFELIKDTNKCEVFVEVDKEAISIWNEFQKIAEMKNKIMQKQEFLKIKAGFYEYVISIPLKTDNKPPEVSGFYYIPNSQLEEYYDVDSGTGFKTSITASIW